MKKFLKSISLFSILFLVLLYVLDLFITSGLKKSESSTYNTINKVFNGTINADLIVNGSSKAYVQISPKILDTRLNLESYNLGLDGNAFIPQLLQYDLYRQHNQKPKIIVQIVGNGFLVKKEELIGYMRYAPFLDNKQITAVTQQYKGFSFLDYHVPFIRYAGYFGIITNGVLSNFGIDKQKDKNYKGYHAMDAQWDNSFDLFKNENPTGIDIAIDSVSKVKFTNYLELAYKDNIHVFMVYPPTYKPSQEYINNREEIIDFYKEVAVNSNALFLDYSNGQISNSKDLFYNSQHLNTKGAEQFTHMLATDIKNHLDGNK